MKDTVIVQYKVKPDRVEENKALIRNVFSELKTYMPVGISYFVLTLDDGGFMHIFSAPEGHEDTLTKLKAFQEFRKDIKARCIEMPQSRHIEELDSYRN